MLQHARGITFHPVWYRCRHTKRRAYHWSGRCWSHISTRLPRSGHPISNFRTARCIFPSKSRLGIDSALESECSPEDYRTSTLRSSAKGRSYLWSAGSFHTHKLVSTNVDSSVKEGEGGFLLMNGLDCEPRYHVYPRSRFLRAGRQKLREVLSSGLPIQFSKQLESFETSNTGCVTAKFSDGTTSQGRLLVGADGNSSAVRSGLTDQKLESLPVNLIGAVRNFTSEQFAPVRALNPLLFFAVNPKTHVFFFYSTQVRLHFPASYLASYPKLGSSARRRRYDNIRCSRGAKLDGPRPQQGCYSTKGRISSRDEEKSRWLCRAPIEHGHGYPG